MRFWIASYPRSGNTYFRILLRNRFGLVSTDPTVGPPSMPTIQGTSLFWPPVVDATAVAGIEGVKTHEPPVAGDSTPAVYLVRDGRDSLVSYAYLALNVASNLAPEQCSREQLQATLRDLILEQRSVYRIWAENVESWIRRRKTHIVRYEDLIANPVRVLDQTLKFLRLKLPVLDPRLPTFAELKSSDSKFFRRGVLGGWAELFTPELLDLFWKFNGKTMKRLGYDDTPARRAA